MKRTFQFSDSKSHKFWNVEVSGTTMTVTYGKIGTAGQESTKTFADEAKAQAEADKLIREKTKKGYLETTPSAVSASDRDLLERAIQADPANRTAWYALADYLTEHGDSQGEFMQVQLSLGEPNLSTEDRQSATKREAAMLKAHARDWLGPMAAFTLDAEPKDIYSGGKLTKQAPVRHEFENGWPSALTFFELRVEQSRAFNHPAMRFVRTLVVENVAAERRRGQVERYVDEEYEPGPDVPENIDPYSSPGLHAMCRVRTLAGIRRFILGEGQIGPDGAEEQYPNCHMSGETAYHLVKQMPEIEELGLFAHRVDAAKLFALPMPRLRVLHLDHSHAYPLDRLAENKSLTNLTTILCHPHGMEFDGETNGAYIRLSHVRALCRSPYLKKLTHLRLRLSDFGDDGIREIVTSGLLKQLQTLDLRGGCVTDEGAAQLVADPGFRNLKFVSLARNALTRAGVQSIESTGVRCDLADQHNEIGPFEDEIPEYLYEGDIE